MSAGLFLLPCCLELTKDFSAPPVDVPVKSDLCLSSNTSHYLVSSIQQPRELGLFYVVLSVSNKEFTECGAACYIRAMTQRQQVSALTAMVDMGSNTACRKSKTMRMA